jgi:hypothetical protein
MLRGFVQRDALPTLGKPHRRGEPGEPGPDHVDRGHRAQSRP